MNAAERVGDRELVISRLLDAPQELVFDAWSDPRHITHWWGPQGFSTTTYAMDFRAGGEWRFCMHGPDGRDYENRITYLEVVRPERLSYQHGGGGEPVDFQVQVTFEPVQNRTRLTMRMIFATAAARTHVIDTYGADKGLTETIGRLAEYVAGLARG
jgi:uncharacterized protein YndB with AHSA1/START domain